MIRSAASSTRSRDRAPRRLGFAFGAIGGTRLVLESRYPTTCGRAAPRSAVERELVEASIVERDLDGQLTMKSEVGKDHYEGTATGGIVGLLVGVISGPLGMLV